jgi:hypothetical protein
VASDSRQRGLEDGYVLIERSGNVPDREGQIGQPFRHRSDRLEKLYVCVYIVVYRPRDKRIDVAAGVEDLAKGADGVEEGGQGGRIGPVRSIDGDADRPYAKADVGHGGLDNGD